MDTSDSEPAENNGRPFDLEEATATLAGDVRDVILWEVASRCGQVPDVHPRLLEGINAAARILADKYRQQPVGGRGWFADVDPEALDLNAWQPCFDNGSGHIPSFEMWFETKAECEAWIIDNVIGAGWTVTTTPGTEVS